MNRKELLAEVKKLASENLKKTIEWRRHIHSHPELSFMEHETTSFVSEVLHSIGIQVIDRPTETGLVAMISGPSGSETIALRADLDALPITEEQGRSYGSKYDGVMHACGHDAHAASLLGAASILQTLRGHLNCSVKLIFQPGEEKMPGGASKMIEKGVLKNPEVRDMVGQHVFPFLPAGTLGFRPGMYMASCDELYITVKGKGGHGALPERLIDPVLISAQIITSLQQVISRRASPKDPSVLSIGKVIANGATNVIPDEVYMEGTFRAMNESWREKAHEIIRQTVEGIALSFGATAELEIVKGYPCLVNDAGLTNTIRTLAEEFVGSENVKDLDLWMGAEDFSYYTHKVPSVFYRFGTASHDGKYQSPVHTSVFDIDEKSLETSSGFMAWTVLGRQ